MNATTLTMLKSRRRVIATIEPDPEWPGMWRVRCGGSLSDMVNLSRAKDMVISIALSDGARLLQEELRDRLRPSAFCASRPSRRGRDAKSIYSP
jgi:hypothetical protein